MKSDSETKDIPYSFGAVPSAAVRRIDSHSWWEIFMQLVTNLPKRTEQLRLSDDPVFLVHGARFSMRDVATKAIQAAEDEGDYRTAAHYKETAAKLVMSYDRLAQSRIRRFYDERFSRLVVASGVCLFLALGLTALYLQIRPQSIALPAILLSFAVLSVGTAMGAFFVLKKKDTILRVTHTKKVKDENARIQEENFPKN